MVRETQISLDLNIIEVGAGLTTLDIVATKEVAIINDITTSEEGGIMAITIALVGRISTISKATTNQEALDIAITRLAIEITTELSYSI